MRSGVASMVMPSVSPARASGKSASPASGRVLSSASGLPNSRVNPASSVRRMKREPGPISRK
jgi:hypothetical protein